jgi:hypothetical protein
MVIVEPTPRKTVTNQNGLEIRDYENRAATALDVQNPRLAVNNRNLADYYRSANNSPLEDFPKSTLTPSMDMSAFKSREKKFSGKIMSAKF